MTVRRFDLAAEQLISSSELQSVDPQWEQIQTLQRILALIHGVMVEDERQHRHRKAR